MGRSYLSEELGEEITYRFYGWWAREICRWQVDLNRSYEEGKEKFMHSIEGVSADIRVETSLSLSGEVRNYYYCTVLRGDRIFEVWSYGDSQTWHAKH